MASLKGSSNPSHLLSRGKDEQFENISHIIVSEHGSKQEQYENLLSDLDKTSNADSDYYTNAIIAKGKQIFSN
jgi:hypothetical protein